MCLSALEPFPLLEMLFFQIPPHPHASTLDPHSLLYTFSSLSSLLTSTEFSYESCCCPPPSIRMSWQVLESLGYFCSLRCPKCLPRTEDWPLIISHKPASPQSPPPPTPSMATPSLRGPGQKHWRHPWLFHLLHPHPISQEDFFTPPSK